MNEKNQECLNQEPSFDMEARRVIEALRSGVPSRAVGKYFSESRPNIMRMIQNNLDLVSGNEDGRGAGGIAGGGSSVNGGSAGKGRAGNGGSGTFGGSGFGNSGIGSGRGNGFGSGSFSTGMVITGRYGEGKTHLLNTVFSMASDENMVVSYVSLSKETPFDKLYLVYQKLMANTFLPGHEQPGFLHKLEEVTPNSPIASDLLLYANTELQTDRLYYVLRSLLNTEDQDEKFQLQADLEGDFIANTALRKIYRRIFNASAKFRVSFSKTKHTQDYLAFMSHMFRTLGYNGWVILFDEAELVGRLGKKARLNAYRNMYRFLVPGKDPATGKAWGKKISTRNSSKPSAGAISDGLGKRETSSQALYSERVDAPLNVDVSAGVSADISAGKELSEKTEQATAVEKVYRNADRMDDSYSHALESTFSLFAFSSSYEEDVIDGKHDRENLADLFMDDPAGQDVIGTVIQMITKAPQLQPLTREEICQTLERMEEFHGRAYNWNPQVSAETLLRAVQGSGYLLRTRLRAAIEILDQLYQYGEAGGIRVDELGKETYEEDDTPEVPEL